VLFVTWLKRGDAGPNGRAVWCEGYDRSPAKTVGSNPTGGMDVCLLWVLCVVTHNDTSQSVGLFWTSDQLVAETSTWQHTTLTTNIHAPGGIRTHDFSRRAAVDLRLRPCGHWDRHYNHLSVINLKQFMTSGFSPGVGKICTLLGFYASQNASFLPTLRDNLSGPILQVQVVQKIFWDCVALKDGTGKLPRNVGKKPPFYTQ